jgi:hypothetical protein
MATWRITGDLRVAYVGDRGGEEDCGQASDPCCALEDVEAWATVEAKPWDVVTSPKGNFVRLRGERMLS